MSLQQYTSPNTKMHPSTKFHQISQPSNQPTRAESIQPVVQHNPQVGASSLQGISVASEGQSSNHPTSNESTAVIPPPWMMGVWTASSVAYTRTQADLLQCQLTSYELRHQRAVNRGHRCYAELLLWRHYITMAFRTMYSDTADDYLEDFQLAVDHDDVTF